MNAVCENKTNKKKIYNKNGYFNDKQKKNVFKKKN